MNQLAIYRVSVHTLPAVITPSPRFRTPPPSSPLPAVEKAALWGPVQIRIGIRAAVRNHHRPVIGVARQRFRRSW